MSGDDSRSYTLPPTIRLIPMSTAAVQHRGGAGGDTKTVGGLVSVENSTPEVIHVVNMTSPASSRETAGGAHKMSPGLSALNAALSNMHTITLSGANINFPLNLV